MPDLGTQSDGEVDLVEQPRRPSKRLLALGGAAAVALALGGGAAALAASPSSSGATGTAAAASGTAASGSASSAPKTPPVRTPHLEGKVKSVSGTKILIMDRDGFTRTIITSSATKYTDSLTASPAVGTEIHAEGKVDVDGTDLDATSIGKGHAFGPGGRGGHGGFGPGGPGGGPGPRSGSTPPSGSAPSSVPTPKAS